MLVSTLVGDSVDFRVLANRGNRERNMPVENANRGKDGVIHGCTRVVGKALVAERVVKVIGAHVRADLKLNE